LQFALPNARWRKVARNYQSATPLSRRTTGGRRGAMTLTAPAQQRGSRGPETVKNNSILSFLTVSGPMPLGSMPLGSMPLGSMPL